MKRLKGKVATGLIVAMLVSTLNAPGSSLAQVPEEAETVLGIATASDADKKGYEIATNSNASEDDEADELFEEELINDLEKEEDNDLEDEELSLGKASDSNANAAFYYVQEVDGYVISLSAEDGILPENTVAQVELIEGEEEKDIKETIEAQAYDKKIVDKAVTFDITFWNDAEEVEPVNGNVTVAVQLSKEMEEAAKDSNAQVSVFDTAFVDEVNSVETSVNTPKKVVYDMEAAAIYQAAAFFVGPHRMHFIKLVSDAGERIDQSKITELFALQEDKICGYIDILLSVGGNKTSIDDKTKGENMADSNATDDTKSAWNIDRLTSDMRCSKVMGDQLAQLIKYCRLSGIDYKAVLDEYYTNGLLPCESKREGKKCLFELKQRLL